jgi:hypothetical protein
VDTRLRSTQATIVHSERGFYPFLAPIRKIATAALPDRSAKYGWRPVFIGVGLTSVAWVAAWIKWMPRGRAIERSVFAAPGFADILRQRSFWGVCAGHFSVNYLAYFMLTLLLLYLVRERHLSMQSMAKAASAYYAIEGLSAITTGWFSDFFIRRSCKSTLVRKFAMAVAHTIVVIALAGCALANSHWYLFCLAAVGIGCGTARAGPFAFFLDPCRPAGDVGFWGRPSRTSQLGIRVRRSTGSGCHLPIGALKGPIRTSLKRRHSLRQVVD